MTDAKAVDTQAGCGKGVSVALAAVTGGNFISECCGMLGSLIGCSVEAMVIDNDMLGDILRVLTGVEITDEILPERFPILLKAVNVRSGNGRWQGARSA